MNYAALGVVLVALIIGRAVGFWLSYRNPMGYVVWVKLCGLALLLFAVAILLFRDGFAAVNASGFISIAYGVSMLLAAGYTIVETMKSQKKK